MGLDPLLDTFGVAAVAIVLVLTVGTMAAFGFLNGTRFGRSIYVAMLLVFGIGVLQQALAPNLLNEIGISLDEAALLATALVLLAGLAGAAADLQALISRRERNQ
jgi:ABC-type glycerol-3-phosphate transport system permease component